MQVILTKEHTEQKFYDSIYVVTHSHKTIATYKTAINHLRKFLETEYGFDETKLAEKIKQNQLDTYEFLRSFVVYLDKKGIKPNGLRSYLSGVKGYLRFLGVKISSDDYKLLVKIPKVVRTKEIPLTKEMIHQLLRNASPKLQTAILVSVASGLRLGELVSLQLNDIDFDSIPTKITIRGSASKGRFSRETFLTTEATNALKDYLKHYFDWVDGEKNEHLQEKLIFWRISRPKSSTKKPRFNPENAKQSFQISITRHISKIPELNVRNENG